MHERKAVANSATQVFQPKLCKIFPNTFSCISSLSRFSSESVFSLSNKDIHSVLEFRTCYRTDAMKTVLMRFCDKQGSTDTCPQKALPFERTLFGHVSVSLATRGRMVSLISIPPVPHTPIPARRDSKKAYSMETSTTSDCRSHLRRSMKPGRRTG